MIYPLKITLLNYFCIVWPYLPVGEVHEGWQLHVELGRLTRHQVLHLHSTGHHTATGGKHDGQLHDYMSKHEHTLVKP